MGFVPLQVPPWQTSFCVQALPSSHGVSFWGVGAEVAAGAGLEVLSVWSWWEVVLVGLVPVQVPPWQTSVCVQALPSSHGVSSSLAGLEHAPVAGLQMPAVWHWS